MSYDIDFDKKLWHYDINSFILNSFLNISGHLHSNHVHCSVELATKF